MWLRYGIGNKSRIENLPIKQVEKMISIKINSVVYDLPQSWDEVSVKQYVEIESKREELNPVMLLSVLTGLSYETLNNFPCDEFETDVMPELQWIGEPFNPFELKRSKVLNIGKYEVEPLLFLDKERLGQKLLMQQMIDNAMKEKAPHSTLVAPVLACYYAPFLHPENKWDEKHVKVVEEMINKMSVKEAYPEATFFLRGWLTFSKKKALS